MLEGINTLFHVFRDFVVALFSMPFYDTISVGWLIVAMEIVGLVATFLISNMRK